jgi:hypothetical protein
MAKQTHNSSIEATDEKMGSTVAQDSDMAVFAASFGMPTANQLKEEAKRQKEALNAEKLKNGEPIESEIINEEDDSDLSDDDELSGDGGGDDSEATPRPNLNTNERVKNAVKLLDFGNRKLLPNAYERYVLTDEQREALRLTQQGEAAPTQHKQAIADYADYLNSLSFTKSEKEEMEAVLSDLFKQINVEGLSTGQYAFGVIITIYGMRLLPFFGAAFEKILAKIMP